MTSVSRLSFTVGVCVLLAMLGISMPATAGPLGAAIYNHCVGFNCTSVHDAGTSSFSTSTNLYSLNSYTTLDTTGPTVGAYLSYSESTPGALGTLYGPNNPGYHYYSYSGVDFEFEVLSSVANKPVKVNVLAQGNVSASDSGAAVGGSYAYFSIDPTYGQTGYPYSQINGATECISTTSVLNSSSNYCSLYFPGEFAGTSFNMNNTVQLLTDVVYHVAMQSEADFWSYGLDNGVLTAFVDPSISIAPDSDETLVFSDGITVQGPATVPEPSLVALFFIGLAGLSMFIGKGSGRRGRSATARPDRVLRKSQSKTPPSF